MNWDPDLYGSFQGPRLRPALDLLARVELESPKIIYDLGCGPGEVTRLLAARWPDAVVTGVDTSTEMLEKARASDGQTKQPFDGQTKRPGGDINWVEGDIGEFETEKADLIYSNAAFNWIADHDIVLPRYLNSLRPGGVLAIQMPRNYGDVTHVAMAESANAGPWRDALAHLIIDPPVAEPSRYYDILSRLAENLEVWETRYFHKLEGEDPIVEWFQATTLRPFLEAVGSKFRDAFLADYRARIRLAYLRQADGRTLLPMRRVFVLATMKAS